MGHLGTMCSLKGKKKKKVGGSNVRWVRHLWLDEEKAIPFFNSCFLLFEWKEGWLCRNGLVGNSAEWGGRGAAVSVRKSAGLWSSSHCLGASCPQGGHVRSPSLKFLTYETDFGLECPLGILQAHVVPSAGVQMALRTEVGTRPAFAEFVPSTGVPTLISAWAS